MCHSVHSKSYKVFWFYFIFSFSQLLHLKVYITQNDTVSPSENYGLHFYSMVLLSAGNVSAALHSGIQIRARYQI